ncbi:hypothetical protein YWY31_17210 [Paenibacillus illinoisensis]
MAKRCPPSRRRKLPPFAKRSREPGQGAKPCPQAPQAQEAPALRGAEQGARAGGEALPEMVALKLGLDSA